MSLQEVIYDGVTLNLKLARGVEPPQLFLVQDSFSKPQANGNILVVIRSR